MSRRDKLLAALRAAGREHSSAEITFHAALSERMGLSTVEEKALDLLERHGPLTAGALGQRTGLAPASVTGLIDRLVRKGYVRRTAHGEDRRRVNVELDPDYLERVSPLFGRAQAGFEELYRWYTDAELDLILGFLQRSTRVLEESAAELSRL